MRSTERYIGIARKNKISRRKNSDEGIYVDREIWRRIDIRRRKLRSGWGRFDKKRYNRDRMLHRDLCYHVVMLSMLMYYIQRHTKWYPFNDCV